MIGRVCSVIALDVRILHLKHTITLLDFYWHRIEAFKVYTFTQIAVRPLILTF